jgi:hypothetical protein
MLGAGKSMRGTMMEASARPERSAEGEFRIGGVLNRTWSVLSRNFLMFFAVTAIASLPDLLFNNHGQDRGVFIGAAVVGGVESSPSSALPSAPRSSWPSASAS